MKLKLLSIALALFFIIMLVPMNTRAGYTMAISGKSDFLAPPFQGQTFNTTDVYVRVYLNEFSPSSLEVKMSVEGTLAQYISFPDYGGTGATFTLFPGQNQRVRYQLNFPASAPGKYYGAIVAVGTPPESVVNAGSAAAIGKPVVSINIAVDVPTDVQIYDFKASKPGGFQDGQWASWGDGWSSSLNVINGGNKTFTGNCNLTLSDSSGILEYEVFNVTNLTGNGGALSINKTWMNGLALKTAYRVTATVYNSSVIKDTETIGFYIPSPADIISVNQNPDIVFWGDTVAIYATLASSDSNVTLNYRVNNGTDISVPMTYSSTTGEFSASIPSQDIGSMVYYWVTSENGQFTDRSPDGLGFYSYYVFSPNVPDLEINGNSYLFTPIDPFTQAMNETDTTVIYITVRNLGRGDASDVNVRIYDGETAIWNTTIPSISGNGGSEIVHYSWSPLEGEHILRLAVDPEDAIIELNENNNHYTLDPITIHSAPPVQPPEQPPSGSILPYILIPIILFIILLFFLRRKKTINVTVSEIKAFKHPKEGTMRWKYTCSYGGGQILGKTRSTDIHAEAGTVIRVRPIGLHENEDGTIVWKDAEVKAVAEDQEPDSEERIRKLVKKEGK